MKNLFFILGLIVSGSALASAQDSSFYYLEKGMEEMQAKKYLVATKQFDEALKHNDKNLEVHYQYALASLEMRKLYNAIEHFDKVVAINPNHAEANKHLTKLYYDYAKYDKAIEFGKKCPNCKDAEKIIGMSYYKQENYTLAVKTLQEFDKKYPGDAEVNYTLGRAFMDMEDYTKTIQFYEAATKADPTKATWLYELGLTYYNISKFAKAAENMEKAAAAGYNQGNDFKENLAFAYIYSGQSEKGEAMIKEVLSRKMGNMSLVRDAAHAFYDSKQYDRSLAFCQMLLEKNDKDGKALWLAGLNFIKKGQKDRGQQMCDEAIKLDPSLEYLKKKVEMPF